MTISDLRCDFCGRLLTGLSSPAADAPAGRHGAVRFVYHPGKPELRDSSGLACEPCWAAAVRPFGEPAGGRCAICGTAAARLASLHLRRYDDPRAWRLCAAHAVDFLNRLRTVEPKLDPAAFRFPYG